MTFSKEQLEELETGYAGVANKYGPLLIRYAHRHYTHPKAAEYAVHGFARRLKLLIRCIDRVFELLPPNLTDIPTKEQVDDSIIYIQAFIFNVFGCVDNMAWIWVYEKNTTKPNGQPLPDN